MKILYIAGRWDPQFQTEYSGNDFGAYQALRSEPGIQLAWQSRSTILPAGRNAAWKKSIGS